MKFRSAPLVKFASFGDLLRYLRKQAQLSQKELAIATGYSESQISRLETNLRAPNPADLMPLFVPALGIQDELETIQGLFDLAQQKRDHVTESPTRKENGVASERAPAEPGSSKVLLHNLPLQLTSFVGRENEIAALRNYITADRARLVTLTGSGGVGKTRLALQVADALLNYFLDGVWWVELALITHPKRLSQVIASVLGLKETSDLPISEILVHYFQNKHLLLILDNCEHLVTACAELVDRLLHTCSKLVILATSREALRVAGEQTYRLPSLTVPESYGLPTVETIKQVSAVRLFTERAAAASQTFELTSQNASSVVEICRRLDGIPLAIELAASRVGVMSPEEIEERLDQRFRLLSTGPRTAIPRQQTLYASIDWSYNLLRPSERLLLQRLTVFSDGWTLDASEAVCGFDGIEEYEVLDLLASLVNKSMINAAPKPVRPSGGVVQKDITRYRMLETIRQYAAEKLAEDHPPGYNPIDVLKHRHLTYYSRLIEPSGYELLGPNQIDWVELLISELANIRATLDWAFEVKSPKIIEEGLRLVSAPLYFWYFFGLGKEAYSWLAAGLDSMTRYGNPHPLLLGKTYKTAAACLFTMGDLQKSREYLVKSIALFRLLGPSYDLAEALSWLVFIGPAQPTDAETLKKESVEVARQTGHTSLLAICLWMGPRSRHDLEEAARLLEKNGDQLFLADVNRIHEMLAWMDGNYAVARSCLQKTLAINQKYSMKTQIAFDFMELALLAYLQGNYSQMELEAQACLEVAGEISFWRMICWAFYYLGVAARRQDHLDQAVHNFKQSLKFACEYQFEETVVENLVGLAGVVLAYGRFTDAIKLLGMAGSHTPFTLEGIPKEDLQRGKAEAQLYLPEEEFLAAWEDGCAMTIDQAVQIALNI